MARIDTPRKISDMEKQLNNTIMKIQVVNLVSARQTEALNTLMKLSLSGVTEDQILKKCRSDGHDFNPYHARFG